MLSNGDSRTDRVTGCLSARGLEERLEAELAVGGRRGEPVALVIVSFGEGRHRASLLRWAAERLGECTRPGDAIARVGAGDFALLLPVTVRSDACIVAARARAAISPRASSCAIGVAGFPEDGIEAEGLLEHARGELGPTPKPPSEEAHATLSWTAAFAEAQERRMTSPNRHNQLVGQHAAEIASRLGWNEDDVAMLRLAAVFHDVGKVALPDRVLAKPGPLTPAEFVQVAEHPVVGARMLARVEGLETASDWVLRSHERYDGSGYPDGLVGEQIPMGARILHLVGAFDAMTSPRPYQVPLSVSDAVDELWRNAGTQFDPGVVAAFEAYVTGANRPGGGGRRDGGDEPQAV